MDQLNKENANLGIVKISDDVISVISAIAASEIEGIADGDTRGLAHKIKNRKNPSKYVKVSMEESAAIIDIAITVKYGVNIPDVVMQAQENIKKTVEAITGLSVSAVNIAVQNIIIAKSEDEKENNEK